MTLRNTEYRITFSSKAGRFYYYFVGNRHTATAEQVLNHILPALAKVKPGVDVTVEYTRTAPYWTPDIRITHPSGGDAWI
jgi:hypothetical protein